ncbi:MAG: hypothetical protein ABIR05_01020 [Luteimonas sp.]
MQTGKWRDRTIAVGLVLGWHALVGWWLLHLPPLRENGASEAIQVVFVTLPPPPVREPSTAARHRTRSESPQHAAPVPASRHLANATAGASADVPALPNARALLAQALDTVRNQAAPQLRSDPLADRPTRLPGRNDGRFRFQRALTPADVVAGIGALLFYPPGYESDQCPRNGRNLANLLAAGDSPALREAVEYERRFCRP